MKNTFILGLTIIVLFLNACNSKEVNQANSTTDTIAQTKPENTEQSTQGDTPGPLMSIETIDSLRSAIEALDMEALEIKSSELREKIRQKWSKLHFYIHKGEIVKIKTYPHPEVSKRTEEFYANNNALILVVIEDNGEGKKGKAKTELDKMYYFNNGDLFKEISNDKESEFGIRNSDAEELLAEFNEYLEVYKNQEN